MTDKTYIMHSNVNEALVAAVKDAEEAEVYADFLEGVLKKAMIVLEFYCYDVGGSKAERFLREYGNLFNKVQSK